LLLIHKAPWFFCARGIGLPSLPSAVPPLHCPAGGAGVREGKTAALPLSPPPRAGEVELLEGGGGLEGGGEGLHPRGAQRHVRQVQAGATAHPPPPLGGGGLPGGGDRERGVGPEDVNPLPRSGRREGGAGGGNTPEPRREGRRPVHSPPPPPPGGGRLNGETGVSASRPGPADNLWPARGEPHKTLTSFITSDLVWSDRGPKQKPTRVQCGAPSNRHSVEGGTRGSGGGRGGTGTDGDR